MMMMMLVMLVTFEPEETSKALGIARIYMYYQREWIKESTIEHIKRKQQQSTEPAT
jgi:hypothetical protein